MAGYEWSGSTEHIEFWDLMSHAVCIGYVADFDKYNRWSEYYTTYYLKKNKKNKYAILKRKKGQNINFSVFTVYLLIVHVVCSM